MLLLTRCLWTSLKWLVYDVSGKPATLKAGGRKRATARVFTRRERRLLFPVLTQGGNIAAKKGQGPATAPSSPARSTSLPDPVGKTYSGSSLDFVIGPSNRKSPPPPGRRDVSPEEEEIVARAEHMAAPRAPRFPYFPPELSLLCPACRRLD